MFRTTIFAITGSALIAIGAPVSATVSLEGGQVAAPETAATDAKPRSQHILSDQELNQERGGEALIVTNQTLTAITQGNVISGDFLAGDVSLSDNALSNFNGIGNIMINTGAQVSLQTGMNLTINIGGE
jgi:propanediol dehydratase small subunit